MVLVMLHRHAPVAPNAPSCRLCETDIERTLQDHLLIGQPGTAELRAAICTRCGDTVERLIEVCGADLDLLVQDRQVSGSTAQPAAE